MDAGNTEGWTMDKAKVIGIYHLKTETDFNVPQEYAGASQTVRVPAGDYPIEVRRDRFGCGYVSIPLPGTLIFDSFYNRVGAVGSTRVSRPNTPTTHHLQPYAYVVEQMAERGEASITVPRAEWGVYCV